MVGKEERLETLKNFLLNEVKIEMPNKSATPQLCWYGAYNSIELDNYTLNNFPEICYEKIDKALSEGKQAYAFEKTSDYPYLLRYDANGVLSVKKLTDPGVEPAVTEKPGIWKRFANTITFGSAYQEDLKSYSDYLQWSQKKAELLAAVSPIRIVKPNHNIQVIKDYFKDPNEAEKEQRSRIIDSNMTANMEDIRKLTEQVGIDLKDPEFGNAILIEHHEEDEPISLSIPWSGCFELQNPDQLYDHIIKCASSEAYVYIFDKESNDPYVISSDDLCRISIEKLQDPGPSPDPVEAPGFWKRIANSLTNGSAYKDDFKAYDDNQQVLKEWEVQKAKLERAEQAIKERTDLLSKKASSSVPFDDLLKKENMTKDSEIQKSGAVKNASKDLSKNDPAAKNTL